MAVKEYKHIYFLGIGGIGMSALARYFSLRNIKVSGYDKTPSPLTEELISEGIQVHYNDSPENLPKDIDLVVYTPAIPKEHQEYCFFRSSDIPMMKRSEILGLITENSETIAVAGTHGKTSVTSMISHILKSGGLDISAFIGGIAINYNTNAIISQTSKITVVEADEFDRSFLTLQPSIAVITSMDADHLDIYGTKNELEKTFSMFADKIVDNGTLLLKETLSLEKSNKNLNIFTYGKEENADFRYSNIRFNEGELLFDFTYPDNGVRKTFPVTMPLSVFYNVENATVALAVAILKNLNESACQKALYEYKGVKRRFESHIKRNDFVYIDDYAHHPEELKASIMSAKRLFPEKKITGIFQPHLFTRTRDFADEFCRSLELLDTVILLDIYPAREEPIPGIDSQMLLNNIRKENKYLVKKEELISKLSELKPEILMTLGAGDIDQLIEPIKKAFAK